MVGACITQKPDICKVAFPAVGVLDMLRYHKFTAGAGWAYDYGTSEESKEMFDYLYQYSPLHNIKEAAYPAILITTADHDDRVVPAHSFKFAATLQEKHKGENPVLIRIDTNSGHGSSNTAKAIELTADIYCFIFHNMGIKPEFKNNYGGDAGFFKAAIDLYMHDLIAKTKETGEPQMTCYAGTAGAVIFDEGTISSCENLEATGNLRDFDWDFGAAWNSPAMVARRKKAKNGCFCTHESNSYYPSLPFNPKHLIQIKKLERQMKKASKEMEKMLPQSEGIAVKA